MSPARSCPRLRWLVLAAAALFAQSAFAGLAPDQLAAIGVRPPPGARLPLDARLANLDGGPTTLGQAIGGRPAVVDFADYACTQLCSPILGVAARALAASGLKPGADYRLVTIGFNPRADAADANRMIDGEIGWNSPIGRAMTALAADDANARRLTAAAGYTYAYDAEFKRYAHPAALIVVAADGRVSRVLSGLAVTPEDLRLALVEAGNGGVGTIVDQVRLLCYGFSASVGYYTDDVRLALAGAGAATLLALGAGVLTAARLSRRRNA